MIKNGLKMNFLIWSLILTFYLSLYFGATVDQSDKNFIGWKYKMTRELCNSDTRGSCLHYFF